MSEYLHIIVVSWGSPVPSKMGGLPGIKVTVRCVDTICTLMSVGSSCGIQTCQLRYRQIFPTRFI